MNSVVIHSTALSTSGIKPVICEGSSVFVRVIEKISDGKFSVVFNGARFTVDSDLPLKSGEKFQAQVKILNGKVNLVPLPDKKASFQSNSYDKSISNLLSSLNLPCDNISCAILNQMKNLSLKIDLNLFKKIRSVVEKKSFKDKEKAASILTVFASKSLAVSENELLQILDFFEQEEKSSSSKRKDENLAQEKSSVSKIISDFSEFFTSLFVCDEKNVFSKNDLSLLSLFNHSGFSLKKSSFSGNWIHIPFEFSFYSSKKSEECLGSGFVNLLLKDSSVSNCVVKFCFPEKSYKFFLKFENEKCNSVLIENLEESFSLEELKAFLKRLPFFSENISVSVCEKDFFSDFEAESFDIFKLNERI